MGYKPMTPKNPVIETCIRLTPSGRYEVQVLLNALLRHGTFETLEEARKFRDEIRAQRPKREGTRSVALTQQREEARELLAAASRKKIKRGGRVYTLIRLPEAGRGVMRTSELHDFYERDLAFTKLKGVAV